MGLAGRACAKSNKSYTSGFFMAAWAYSSAHFYLCMAPEKTKRQSLCRFFYKLRGVLGRRYMPGYSGSTAKG